MNYSSIQSFSSQMQDFKNPHHEHAEQIASDVQSKVKKIEVIVQAMWELMQEQGISVEQLHAKIDELVIDPDRKVKPAYENIKIIKCPKCGKSIQESKATPMIGRCMFCGEQVVFYPFERDDEESSDQEQASDAAESIPSWNGPM